MPEIGPELRARINEAVRDLAAARDIPPERFPGHKAAYCANLEGWLGSFTLSLLNALEALEVVAREAETDVSVFLKIAERDTVAFRRAVDALDRLRALLPATETKETP